MSRLPCSPTLQTAGQALGGVPVFALLGGLGWDALGPVIQACDGRVFTLSTVRSMFEVELLPGLVSTPS